MRLQRINPTSLITMSVPEIIGALSSQVLGGIPEGIDMSDQERVARAEMLLGKLPNDYAYVIELLGYSRHYVRKFKRQGSDFKEQYEDMMDKRDALESISSALKLQYQGLSRQLTMKMEIDKSDEMHEFRKWKGLESR